MGNPFNSGVQKRVPQYIDTYKQGEGSALLSRRGEGHPSGCEGTSPPAATSPFSPVFNHLVMYHNPCFANDLRHFRHVVSTNLVLLPSPPGGRFAPNGAPQKCSETVGSFPQTWGRCPTRGQKHTFRLPCCIRDSLPSQGAWKPRRFAHSPSEAPMASAKSSVGCASTHSTNSKSPFFSPR